MDEMYYCVGRTRPTCNLRKEEQLNLRNLRAAYSYGLNGQYATAGMTAEYTDPSQPNYISPKGMEFGFRDMLSIFGNNRRKAEYGFRRGFMAHC